MVFVFKHSLEQCRCFGLNDGCIMYIACIGSHACWLKTFDQPTMLLGKIVVHNVSHSLGRQSAMLVLGQCLECFPHSTFNLFSSVGSCARSHHSIETFTKTCFQFTRRNHTSGSVTIAKKSTALWRCCTHRCAHQQTKDRKDHLGIETRKEWRE